MTFSTANNRDVRHSKSRYEAAVAPTHARLKSLSFSVLYVVDWLPPDFGAVGQYGVLFGREMAQAGETVCLIGLTSGRARVSRESFSGGGMLEIRHIAADPVNRANHIGRLLWAIRTNLLLLREALRMPRTNGCELLFTGSPPFMLYFALAAKLLTGVQLRYRITDFYPEVIIADRGRTSTPLSLLSRLTWWMRRRVDGFEALGEDQRRILILGGISNRVIRLKRDPSPIAINGEEVALPRPAALVGKFALLYSGNYGVAHEVDTVVEGLSRHHREGSGRFALWLNATGNNAERIEARLRAENLPFARTKPGPLEDLPHLLAAADAHLITLRDAFAGYVLPSKVYACIASRRPVLFVGPPESDVHLLCRDGAVDYCRVAVGDAAGFAASLERLANIRSEADQLAQ